MWSDNVRYYFFSKELGRVLVPEPKNYKDGNGAKYTRDPQSKGVMRKNSNALEFIEAGYEYLLKINTIYGVVPDVRVDRWMKDERRLDQRWTLIGSSGLDITNLEFQHDKKTVKASYTNGGLTDKIGSRLNEVYDLIETTSVNGENIGPLKTVNCSFPGKAIFIESKLDVESGVKFRSIVSGGDKDNVRAIPFQVVTNPDGEQLNNDRSNVYSVTDPDGLGFNNGNFVGAAESAITFLGAERDRNLKLTFRVNFDIEDPQSGFLRFGILKYTNGIDLDFKSFTQLAEINTNGSQRLDYSVENYQLDVLEGESFTIGYYSRTDDGIVVAYKNGNFLNIVDENPAPPTVARCILFKEVFNRLMARAFGRDNMVESELLDSGEFAETLKTNGLFVRQFPDVINEGTDEERRIQFKTSLKKQLEAANCIHPIAWWIAKSGDREVLRIEKLNYTQQGFTGVHYGERDRNGKVQYIPAQKITRKVLSGNYYSSSQIGSIKTGQDYENFFGLTSFCGNAIYNFINDARGEPYTATTEDRTGDLDIEIPRRKPFDKFPDEDTQIDDDLIFVDAKKISTSLYTPRKWQDDFETEPLNVYSPDTAFNFRYSPANLLMNHSYVLNGGLYHYPDEFARWASSNCNSSLITRLIGKAELQEGQPIRHSRFGKAKIKPMLVEFDMPVPLEVEREINGFQTDGTPNWYGKVAVQVDGNIEYMRIIDVDTNKEGKHKMVESQ